MNLETAFTETRNRFITICEGLKTEDYSVQPAIFVSPPKWHLAHSSWFFEQFVLEKYLHGYEIYDEDFSYLFNSYYNNAGKRVLRPNRGLMTRPTVEEVYLYRKHVDEHMRRFFTEKPSEAAKTVILLGIQHEQQHQELFYYDIKYILGNQPTFPKLKQDLQLNEINAKANWISIDKGLYAIGHQGDGFCYDNELGQHQVHLEAFQISDQLVSNAEYLEFMEAGGYSDFNLWHAEGWDFIQQEKIEAPAYWHKLDGIWHNYTFDGFVEVHPKQPVMHLSFYEAFAFAEWKKLRLPTEFEWEVASQHFNYGQLWEWTYSAYLPYPNFTKAPGALGEYNGKFMINQMVLRGASVATCANHSRPTYRNFFHPQLRWQFAGLRLAK